MFKKYINLFLLIVSVNFGLLAQTPATSYPFIKTSINRIENDSIYLQDFYDKLYRLKTQNHGVVRIVHIGDSHIQADMLSGTVRLNMQEQFGNAGRGLIFPYRVANTNGPSDITSGSNVLWAAKRNVFFMNPIPIGISGITIETHAENAYISESLGNTTGRDYSFNHATVFYQQGPDFYDFLISDKSDVSAFEHDSCYFRNSVTFNSIIPVNAITIKTFSQDTCVQKTARLFGVLLQNDSAGVLYNMVGVNGAEYRHYLASEYFAEQLSFLQPDLIIVSLGTNEAMNGNFKSDVFYETINQTIEAIKQKSPNAKFLLTTPPDSYRWYNRRPYKNINTKKAAETIIRYCCDNNIAYWDLNSVMGGYGSMGYWAKYGLSARDYVHFQPKGYKLQGNLLYQAILHNYKKYTR